MNTDSLNKPYQRNIYRMRLIEFVRAHPILWDKTSMDFTQRNVKTQKWLEVSEKLGVSMDKIRRTWENLRDQYRRDLKRSLSTGTPSQWRFFEDMDFIRPMVRIKGLDHKSDGSKTDHGVAEDILGEQNNTMRTLTTQNTIITTANTMKSNCHSSSFVPVQLIADWKQLTNSNQLQQQINRCGSGLPESNQEQKTFPQHSSLHRQHFQPCDCQKFENLKGSNFSIDSQSRSSHNSKSKALITRAPNTEIQKLQYGNYPPISDSDDSEFNDLSFVDVSNEIKIEFESDSNCLDYVSQPRTLTENPQTQYQQPKLEDIRASTPHNKSVSNPSLYNTEGIRVGTISTTNNHSTTNSRYQGQSTETTTDDTHDEDYHFVMSILPTLRQVERNQKFSLRLQIMSLISRALNEANKKQ